MDRNNKRFERHRAAGAVLAALLALLTAPARAMDYQIHGFAAQGFSLSQGNNYFGDSTHGSTDFYELGLNGTASLTPNLLISAQGLMRRAGATDTEGLRLDYAQIDYRFLSMADCQSGIRLGRVKNPFGFYNDTRDVVFTRPGITLPDSVYLESDGLRSILFSRDGAQLYGAMQLGDHDLSLVGNFELDSRLSGREQTQIFAGNNLPVEIDLRNFRVARLQDDWNGGRLKFALSYLHGGLVVEPTAQAQVQGHLDADFYVASIRYNARSYAITGEYLLMQTRTELNIAPPTSVAGDGFYLQGEYRFLPKWTALGRYSAGFADRHDRSGERYAAQTGVDRYSRFSHDETVGLNWQPDAHWGIWAEFHLVQGTSLVPQIDNLGRTKADHWNLFQLMAGYRF